MFVAKQLITVVTFLVFAAACADDHPVRATYVPSDCPPCEGTSEVADEEVAVVEIGPDEVDTFATEGADEPEEPETPEESAPTSAPADDLININTAGELALIELPGVGPALAARIVAYREKRSFKAPDELQRVRGIGPAKFSKMKPLVTVD